MTVLVVAGAIFGALFGAVLASFGCVLGERGLKQAASGRSRCVCGRQLGAHENVPIVGWLATAGKARCCGARIPARYLWCEMFGVGVGAAAGAAAAGGLVLGAALAGAAAAAATLVPAAVCRTVGR